jgi:DnaD/phage-associated family protein
MPNRWLRESICTSDTLDTITAEEERLFYRLIVNCDDYGRMESRPEVVRAKCFPLKSDSVTVQQAEDWLQALQAVGLIRLYTVDGKRYLQMVTWNKYQQVRAKYSKFPAPDNTCTQMQTDVINSTRITNNDIRITNNDNEIDNESTKVLVAFVAQHFGASPYIVERIVSYTEPAPQEQRPEAMDPDCVLRACEIAVERDKRNASYVESILNRWYAANIRTRDQAQYAEREFRNRKTPGQAPTAIVRRDTPEEQARLEQVRREVQALSEQFNPEAKSVEAL